MDSSFTPPAHTAGTQTATCRTLRAPLLKRLFDVSFSLVALLLFALPALVIAALLRCRERHNILFRQQRVGKNKRTFEILKFQTLVNQVPTPTGRVLRKTGLDEIPQFLNVLNGDMSIVGPRALTLQDIERLGWDDRHHEPRWSTKPGITGLAQLYGGQHRKTSWFWDKYYLAHNNVAMDAAIVIVSFLMNLFGKTTVRKTLFRNKHLK